MATIDFPNNPTQGQSFTGQNGAVYMWDGAVWVLTATVAGNNPIGPAGGDLAGTYPNPTIKGGAVSRAKTAADLWLSPIPGAGDVGKTLVVQAGPVLAYGVTGAGGAPSGPAGGSLAGSYPNPTLSLTGAAAGSYGTATAVPQITVTAEGRLTAASSVAIAFPAIPTSLPPSGAAGGDLNGSTYPNPTIAGGAVTRAKTASDLWLAPVPTAGNVGQVLTVAAGPALSWGTPGAGVAGSSYCQVSGSGSLTNATESTLTWTVEKNVGNMWDSGQNVFRIQVAGFYVFGGVVSFQNSGTGTRRVILYEGGNLAAVGQMSAPGSYIVQHGITASAAMYCAVSDTVQMTVFQDCGSTMTTMPPTRAWICRLA